MGRDIDTLVEAYNNVTNIKQQTYGRPALK